MPWLLKSPEQHQTWYWLCKTDNYHRCPIVNFNCLGRQIQDMIKNMNLSFANLKKNNSIYQKLTLLNSLFNRLSWPTLLCPFVQVNLWRPDVFPHLGIMVNADDLHVMSLSCHLQNMGLLLPPSWLCSVKPRYREYGLLSINPHSSRKGPSIEVLLQPVSKKLSFLHILKHNLRISIFCTNGWIIKTIKLSVPPLFGPIPTMFKQCLNPLLTVPGPN